MKSLKISLILAVVTGCIVLHDLRCQKYYQLGFRKGLERVDEIVSYETLTIESIQAIDSIQNRRGVEFKIDGE